MMHGEMLEIGQVSRLACILDQVQPAERTVIILDMEAEWANQLRLFLMATGFDVFFGPDAPGIGRRPVLLVDHAGLKHSASIGRINYARSRFPASPLCVITGGLLEASAGEECEAEQYDDARDLLRAAGIGFLSEVELRDASAA